MKHDDQCEIQQGGKYVGWNVPCHCVARAHGRREALLDNVKATVNEFSREMLERPELPKGYTWADDIDDCGGFLCPHGEYMEVDAEGTLDGCKNPAMTMGWL